jgi:hypothetical protein
MNPTRRAPSRFRESSSHHRDFLLILPVVEKRAQFAFRFLPSVDREEAIAEAVAAAFVSFVGLKARGKSPAAFPVVLALFAVLHVRNGRHVGGSCRSGEVTSYAAQRRHGFRLHLAASELSGWNEQFLDDSATPVLDQVRFKLDWQAFLKSLPRRHRRMVRSLAQGHPAHQVAEAFQVSPSRITQLRQQWQRQWLAFTGDSEVSSADSTQETTMNQAARCGHSHRRRTG